ncbi:fatty acyl-CoA reductase wat-like [Vespa velutina]|uniref:fatty acyl-CoA reductase wat-like n=1 Tax=Vespa velutina TaxID=202808 RepID=UPI001FB2FA5A|nr:fatty acyl-CoA reductase wat-like [Vespa velutina]
MPIIEFHFNWDRVQLEKENKSEQSLFRKYFHIARWIYNVHRTIGITAGAGMGLIETNHQDGLIKVNLMSGVLMIEPLIINVVVREEGYNYNYLDRFGKVEKMKPLWNITSSVKIIDELTPIQKFYDDESVFLTGGTGFMGKLLIEKLLRGCSGIRCIYILIRSKKGKNVLERLDELMEDSLKKVELKFRKRIVAIKGDCSLPNLGIAKIDRVILVHEVSIVFNVIATVRFNEEMKAAIAIIIQSLRDLINLSKEMLNLKSFVRVSTAYANCLHNPIKEIFYDPPMDGDKLIDLMNSLDEKLLNDITPRWIDNMNEPVGITAGILMGLMRTHYCDGSLKINLVSGDLTINGLIASAWDIANNHR